jgi:hypothetical protein
MENDTSSQKRKFNIGDFVIANIGKLQTKGRVSRETLSICEKRTNLYYIHTILGTFLLEDEDFFKFS